MLKIDGKSNIGILFGHDKRTTGYFIPTSIYNYEIELDYLPSIFPGISKYLISLQWLKECISYDQNN